VNAAVVVDETQLAEFVDEEAHARPRGPDHLGERFLADLRDDRLGFAFLAEIRQQQEQPREAFLARIEQLIDQIRFNPDGAAEQMGNEHLGKRRLAMDHIDDGCPFQPHDDGVRHGRDRRDALRLPGQTSLAEEFIRSEKRDDRFLALLGNDGDLRLAFLDIEDRVGGIALREDDLVLAEPINAAALADLGEKGFRIECWPAFRRDDTALLTARL
jgi:hypothetical protein